MCQKRLRQKNWLRIRGIAFELQGPFGSLEEVSGGATHKTMVRVFGGARPDFREKMKEKSPRNSSDALPGQTFFASRNSPTGPEREPFFCPPKKRGMPKLKKYQKTYQKRVEYQATYPEALQCPALPYFGSPEAREIWPSRRQKQGRQVALPRGKQATREGGAPRTKHKGSFIAASSNNPSDCLLMMPDGDIMTSIGDPSRVGMS